MVPMDAGIYERVLRGERHCEVQEWPVTDRDFDGKSDKAMCAAGFRQTELMADTTRDAPLFWRKIR